MIATRPTAHPVRRRLRRRLAAVRCIVAVCRHRRRLTALRRVAAVAVHRRSRRRLTTLRRVVAVAVSRHWRRLTTLARRRTRRVTLVARVGVRRHRRLTAARLLLLLLLVLLVLLLRMTAAANAHRLIELLHIVMRLVVLQHRRRTSRTAVRRMSRLTAACGIRTWRLTAATGMLRWLFERRCIANHTNHDHYRFQTITNRCRSTTTRYLIATAAITETGAEIRRAIDHRDDVAKHRTLCRIDVHHLLEQTVEMRRRL